MFYPENHVQGLWNISVSDTVEDTTVDVKRKSAVVPADVVPILSFAKADNKLYRGLSINVETEWVMIGKPEDCSMQYQNEYIPTGDAKRCRYCDGLEKPPSYRYGVNCLNWKREIKRDEHGNPIFISYPTRVYYYRSGSGGDLATPTNEDPRNYLKRWGFPLRENYLVHHPETSSSYLRLKEAKENGLLEKVFEAKSKIDEDGYDLNIYRRHDDEATEGISYLNVQGMGVIQADIDDQVVFLDNIRNALQYFSLQKKQSKIRSYRISSGYYENDVFDDRDWYIANQFVKWEMLGRRVWFMNENVWHHQTLSVTAITSVLGSIINTTIQSTPMEDLYYYLMDTAIHPLAMSRLLEHIEAESSDRSNTAFDTDNGDYGYEIWCPISEKMVTPYQYIWEFMTQFSRGDESKHKEVMDSITEFCYTTSQKIRTAYGNLISRDTNHITLNRIKNTAAIISNGCLRVRASSSPSIKHSSSAMSDYMDKDSAEFRSMVSKMKSKEESKFIDETAKFNAKYMDGNSAIWEWGTKGSKPTDTSRVRDAWWGQMIVIQPALTRDLKHKLRGRLYKPNEYGTVPAFMDRFATDKRVFKHKKNIKGGTVLIDASGSMSLTEEEVFEILETLPASTVAMYSGSSKKGRARGGADGELVVLAKDQKQIAELPNALGENIIDLPALQWLAKQQTPRIWVSDEGITQLSGRSGHRQEAVVTREGQKECDDLVKRAKIIVLSDIDDVKEFGKNRVR
tara:strand:- start:83 stop:2299 length:2217 start_codon:yes stop_codon:yes gene_type:complete